MNTENGPSRDWFGEKWLKRIDKNVEDSTGLPNALYTDPKFLQFENEQANGKFKSVVQCKRR